MKSLRSAMPEPIVQPPRGPGAGLACADLARAGLTDRALAALVALLNARILGLFAALERMLALWRAGALPLPPAPRSRLPRAAPLPRARAVGVLSWVRGLLHAPPARPGLAPHAPTARAAIPHGVTPEPRPVAPPLSGRHPSRAAAPPRDRPSLSPSPSPSPIPTPIAIAIAIANPACQATARPGRHPAAPVSPAGRPDQPHASAISARFLFLSVQPLSPLCALLVTITQ